MNNQYQKNAMVFKALCDESRLRIIDLLRKGEEICACVLLDDLSIGQSTLSHHMKILVQSGLVDVRKDGKRMMYSLSSEGVEQAISLLDGLLRK